MFANLNPLQRSLLSAFAGLLAYGGWAYIANMSHGAVAGFKAACVQGSYSFGLTLVMTLLIEGIFRLISNRNAGEAISDSRGAGFSDGDSKNSSSASSRKAELITVLIVCSILYFSSWLINFIAGTPEILMTILPGYIIGTVYTVTYVGQLKRVLS